MAARGGGAKSGGALPNLRSFRPKTAFFGPKRPPNLVKTAKRRETVATLHVRLDFLVTEEPSSALLLHDMSEKRPKKAPKSPKICAMCTNTPKPSTYLGLRGSNPSSEGT